MRTSDSSIKNAWALAGFVALCLAIGAVSGAVTSASVGTWYAELEKPAFNPPDWVFGPVWTVLYLMMAFAAWRVWRLRGLVGARTALGVWAVQLALNLCWSLVFFGLRMPGAALAEIGALLAAIALTLTLFWRLDPLAGVLLVPYAVWVGFAALLNAAIWRMN